MLTPEWAKHAIVVAVSVAALQLVAPATAAAVVPQRPRNHVSAPAPAKPARPADREHRERLGRGFDGSGLFCLLAAVRVRAGLDEWHTPTRELSRRAIDSALESASYALLLSVDIRPGYRLATHLSI